MSKRQRLSGYCAALLITATAPAAHSAITIDGTRNTVAETEYAEVVVQTITTGWGTGNAIANLHSAQTGKLLNLFIAGRVNGNAIILFIDSKPGGVSSITNDLIKSGGFESDINNLAPGSGTGMTFESGFEPDQAIRIYGTGTDAYASLFDFSKRIRIDLGQVNNTTVSHGPVAGISAVWTDVGVGSGTYGDAVDGVEMALNMALLGVPEGDQDMKVMAILVNADSTYGSNQVLGPLGTTADMAGGVNTFNFDTEAGDQTQTIAVNRPALVAGDDEDGDGINNDTDPFPLDQTRDITFRVDMNVEAAKGYFSPPSSVQAQFFHGSQPPLSTLTLTDPDSDLIYTGTLADAKGFEGDPFGAYKFITDDPNNTNSGYEFGFDRTFNLAVAETTQVLATVFFSNDPFLSFAAWSEVNAGGQSADQDFDNDGMPNGVEHFMGETGSSFTPNPAPVNGMVSWPRGPYVPGGIFKVWISENLSAWADVTDDADVSNPALVSYTIPTTTPKLFVRLEVTEP